MRLWPQPHELEAANELLEQRIEELRAELGFIADLGPDDVDTAPWCAVYALDKDKHRAGLT